MNMQPFYNRVGAVIKALNIFQREKKEIQERLHNIERRAQKLADDQQIDAVKRDIENL